MSTLKAKLRERAERELNGLVDALIVSAGRRAPKSITGSELLRIAAGGKTQVLRNKAIKALTDAKEAELLESLSKQETE